MCSERDVCGSSALHSSFLSWAVPLPEPQHPSSVSPAQSLPSSRKGTEALQCWVSQGPTWNRGTHRAGKARAELQWEREEEEVEISHSHTLNSANQVLPSPCCGEEISLRELKELPKNTQPSTSQRLDLNADLLESKEMFLQRKTLHIPSEKCKERTQS